MNHIEVDAGHPGTAGQGGGTAGLGSGGGGSAGSIPDAAPPDYGAPSVCGNGHKESGEECDDGNATSSDGCSSVCQVERFFTCLMENKPCVHDTICGDHMIEGAESCDDGNQTDGDGCAADCGKVECGWECAGGTLCRAAKCGDGMLAGNEQCDDGNIVNGDGCSSICTLESRPVAEPEGWLCTSPTVNGCKGPTTCAKTTCGDNKKEGSEQCEDGNTMTGDGCSPFCRLEPQCPATGGPCTTACGDGLLLPIDKKNGQECDDGNTVDGDGCSKDCKEEPGYKCTDISTKLDKLVLPVVYHDFKNWNEAGGHVDFGHFQGNGKGFAGIVKPLLGSKGVPDHVAGCWPMPGAGYPGLLTANGCAPGGVPAPGGTWDATVDWFGMWYVDNALSKTVVDTMTLMPIAGGAFQFNDDAFFPLDGKGWAAGAAGQNFGFTSVTRTWFEYTGTSTLTFVGDDDVWVFVNKKLAVDLGGTHQKSSGSITLDALNGHGYACDFVAPGNAYPSPACDAVTNKVGHDVDLGLVMGGVYEIVVFQAERFPTESHYQLTLSGFTGIKSACVGACGDGVVTAPEKCDLGAAKNTGAYGGCKADCTVAPYCGDGHVDLPDEECDGASDCSKSCKKIMIQ